MPKFGKHPTGPLPYGLPVRAARASPIKRRPSGAAGRGAPGCAYGYSNCFLTFLLLLFDKNRLYSSKAINPYRRKADIKRCEANYENDEICCDLFGSIATWSTQKTCGHAEMLLRKRIRRAKEKNKIEQCYLVKISEHNLENNYSDVLGNVLYYR